MFLSGIAKVIKIIPLSLMLGFLSDISSALQIEPGPVTESEAVNGGDDSCVEDLVVDKINSTSEYGPPLLDSNYLVLIKTIT